MRPLRVVLSGPESTGKTTLARQLADRYRTTWAPEFVRSFLERLPPRDPPSLVLFEEVEAIARGQLEAEDDAVRGARDVVFLDTDLHSTKVYAEHYFGRCPEWVARAARERRYDLHLLLDVDAPWTPDPIRDRTAQRTEMIERFRRELRAAGRRVVELSGSWQRRREAAVSAVDAALSPS